jgi:hypothetical protein
MPSCEYAIHHYVIECRQVRAILQNVHLKDLNVGIATARRISKLVG